MEQWELDQRQSLLLPQKIIHTKDRIKDFYNSMRGDIVIIKHKDPDRNAVLRHLMPDVPFVQSKQKGYGNIYGTIANDNPETLAEYLLKGCNDLTEGEERSWPLGIWTEKDINQYINFYMRLPK